MNAKTQILVADDDEGVRRSYVRSLQGNHCEVREVFDGVQVLQAMEQRPCDVVLLDVRMPGMDGIEVLAAIKQRWPHSQVVIITGYPSVDGVKAALRLGAYDYLAKPVGPDQVVAAAQGAARQKHWALHIEHADWNERNESSPTRCINNPVYAN